MPPLPRRRALVVREGGSRVGGRRVLLEEVEDHLDRLLELRVASFADRLRVALDLDVRRDAGILDLPLALEAVNPDPGRRDEAAVEELRVVVDADEPAPGPGSDERPDPGFPEEPRHRVAPRAGRLVDEHHL